ncbi:alpha/beta hydrolase [Prescottella agglutinans]|uniref:Diacylglycerol O-acyltransferase/trehalose O-mycolyltransferase n=1 Tax=Prescottella agglutinans TaxID=1644129 RepID=A0ABT6M9G1_9NOCA|nr:alpha/beta hydrolase family protein [Prescottella agglutinans]MDH6280520.1 diacylglycerol O-acyltransferase/trehalose O-mycolyltransferase [Prescottella agglutinans]
MRSSRVERARVLAAAVVVSAAWLLAVPATASADSGTTAAANASGAYLVKSTADSDRRVTISVHSPAMDRDIPLEVIRPADRSRPRPTLYLLNGAGGGEDSATWQRRTDVIDFFADKNVNVVTPLEGASSYYTDWQKDDPTLGRQKWQTFLLDELPPVVDAEFGTDEVQSIAAISMTATSVLNLAIAKPGFYKSVGSYSGCAETSTWAGQNAIQAVTGIRGGADITNMWGPLDGPGWAENDPVVNAEKLRGTELYVTSASGLPGPRETLDSPGIDGDPSVLAERVMGGGAIELVTNYCTHNLAYRLADLQIPATFDFKPTGTHTWGYWEDDLHNSWPMIARSMGI